MAPARVPADGVALPSDLFAWTRRDRRAWMSAHPEATKAYLRERIARLSPLELAELRSKVQQDVGDDLTVTT